MVLRQGPEHHFYGCTGYPDECRHTLTIAQAHGLQKHIEERKIANKGKAAKSAVKKRLDWTAAVRVAEAALHRSTNQHQEASAQSSMDSKAQEEATRTTTGKGSNHRGTDCLRQPRSCVSMNGLGRDRAKKLKRRMNQVDPLIIDENV